MNRYLSQPEICADFIQNFVFGNETKITKDMIHMQINRQSVYLKKDGRKPTAKEKYRDLLIFVCKDVVYLVVGIENQSELSNIIPVRSMLYDAIGYEDQIYQLQKKHQDARDLDSEDYLSGINRHDKLIPVITMIFYFGEKAWDRAETLFDMLDFSGLSTSVINMIQNYKINLVDIHNIENTETFRTSLGPVIELMKIRKDRNALETYIESHQDFLMKTSDEVFDIIAELMDSQWLINRKKEFQSKKGGRYNMCTGMKVWLEEVRIDGEDTGRKEGRKEGIQTACRIIDEICQGYSLAELTEKYQIDADEMMMLASRAGRPAAAS